MSIENEILSKTLEYLTGIIGETNVHRENTTDISFDGFIHIMGIKFLYEIKKTVGSSNFGSVFKHLKEVEKKKEGPVMLIAQNIYPQLMRELIKHEISSIDSAGNCCIKSDGIFLYVEGKKQQYFPDASADRIFKEAGIKVIFQFLLNPELVTLPYREIQRLTDVSLGSIKNIIENLINNQFVVKTKNGRFLKNKKELLNRFVIAYNDILKPKLFIKRMAFRSVEQKKLWAQTALPSGALWSGEPAAYLHDEYLLPGEYTIYVEGEQTGNLIKTANLIPDKEGEVLIYRKFWNGSELKRKTVPALLIYADLMGSGNSRNIEAAQRLYDNELQYLQ